MVDPEQDSSTGDLPKADERQVAHQAAPVDAIEGVEADGESSQQQGGDTAVEQKRGLHKPADAGFPAVELPQLLQARQVFLAPFHDGGIIVDHELDAVRHGFQPAQGYQPFHRGGEHLVHGSAKGGVFDFEWIWVGGNTFEMRSEQADSHRDG